MRKMNGIIGLEQDRFLDLGDNIVCQFLKIGGIYHRKDDFPMDVQVFLNRPIANSWVS